MCRPMPNDWPGSQVSPARRAWRSCWRKRRPSFVDGRYTLQVGDQIDPAVFEVRHIADQPASDWLRESLSGGGQLGYDPWLHTAQGAARLRTACEAVGAELVPVPKNPIDRLWQDRPGRPDAPFEIHPPELAGETSADKRSALAEKLAARGVEAAVLTLPDSIAWLLNIRGRDVPRTPFPLSFAILRNDGGVSLFAPAGKVDGALAQHLGDSVAVESPNAFEAALAGFAGRKVLVDPATAADRIFQVLAAAGALVAREADPCQLPKACKNAVELEGARNAHRRDGAALTRFLAWLAREAPGGNVDELAAADRLERYRRDSNLLRDLSFDTISGAGPNGAIVHYRVTPETNRKLAPGTLYLVDSGGQYPDGTTDVTRTVAIGAPTAEMRRRFTLVLKGHIALARARFPAGTTGSQLDTLARMALWADGLDYDHGTGHGVGSYLSVHEGPQRISKLPNSIALQPGMIVSNEPGYYRTGQYGIRIENLVAVRELDVDGAERSMLGFETLTLAPIDRTLIDRGLLTAEETAWVDGYHARVREKIGPLVDPDTAAWLDEATRPL